MACVPHSMYGADHPFRKLPMPVNLLRMLVESMNPRNGGDLVFRCFILLGFYGCLRPNSHQLLRLKHVEFSCEIAEGGLRVMVTLQVPDLKLWTDNAVSRQGNRKVALFEQVPESMCPVRAVVSLLTFLGAWDRPFEEACRAGQLPESGRMLWSGASSRRCAAPAWTGTERCVPLHLPPSSFSRSLHKKCHVSASGWDASSRLLCKCEVHSVAVDPVSLKALGCLLPVQFRREDKTRLLRRWLMHVGMKEQDAAEYSLYSFRSGGAGAMAAQAMDASGGVLPSAMADFHWEGPRPRGGQDEGHDGVLHQEDGRESHGQPELAPRCGGRGAQVHSCFTGQRPAPGGLPAAVFLLLAQTQTTLLSLVSSKSLFCMPNTEACFSLVCRVSLCFRRVCTSTLPAGPTASTWPGKWPGHRPRPRSSAPSCKTRSWGRPGTTWRR